METAISIGIDKIVLGERLQIEQLAIDKSQFVHVLGANGAGKSTLLASLAGLINETRPQVFFQQRLLSDWTLGELANYRCYLTQAVVSQFDISVADTLNYFAGSDRVPASIESALEITHLMQRRLNQLSGGEQQRVHIVRCLMQVWPMIQEGKALILMDEPCQGLDIRHQISLMQLLSRLAEQGNTLVIASHDINLAVRFSTQSLFLKQGCVLAFGQTHSVISLDNLKKCFECDFHLNYSENAYDFFSPRVN